MKLLEIIENLDKSEKNRNHIYSEHFIDEFNLSWYDLKEDTRLTSYYILNWYCTDTYVGLAAYFLDDEFVCIGYQEGRKCDEKFEFVSEELATKVGEYVKSLIIHEPCTSHDYINFDEDYGTGFIRNFREEFMTSKGILKETNEKVNIDRNRLVLTESEKEYVDLKYHKVWDEKLVRITLENGETTIVLAEEIELSFNLKEIIL